MAGIRNTRFAARRWREENLQGETNGTRTGMEIIPELRRSKRKMQDTGTGQLMSNRTKAVAIDHLIDNNRRSNGIIDKGRDRLHSLNATKQLFERKGMPKTKAATRKGNGDANFNKRLRLEQNTGVKQADKDDLTCKIPNSRVKKRKQTHGHRIDSEAIEYGNDNEMGTVDLETIELGEATMILQSSPFVKRRQYQSRSSEQGESFPVNTLRGETLRSDYSDEKQPMFEAEQSSLKHKSIPAKMDGRRTRSTGLSLSSVSETVLLESQEKVSRTGCDFGSKIGMKSNKIILQEKSEIESSGIGQQQTSPSETGIASSVRELESDGCLHQDHIEQSSEKVAQCTPIHDAESREVQILQKRSKKRGHLSKKKSLLNSKKSLMRRQSLMSPADGQQEHQVKPPFDTKQHLEMISDKVQQMTEIKSVRIGQQEVSPSETLVFSSLRKPDSDLCLAQGSMCKKSARGTQDYNAEGHSKEFQIVDDKLKRHMCLSKKKSLMNLKKSSLMEKKSHMREREGKDKNQVKSCLEMELEMTCDQTMLQQKSEVGVVEMEQEELYLAEKFLAPTMKSLESDVCLPCDNVQIPDKDAGSRQDHNVEGNGREVQMVYNRLRKSDHLSKKISSIRNDFEIATTSFETSLQMQSETDGMEQKVSALIERSLPAVKDVVPNIVLPEKIMQNCDKVLKSSSKDGHVLDNRSGCLSQEITGTDGKQPFEVETETASCFVTLQMTSHQLQYEDVMQAEIADAMVEKEISNTGVQVGHKSAVARSENDGLCKVHGSKEHHAKVPFPLESEPISSANASQEKQDFQVLFNSKTIATYNRKRKSNGAGIDVSDSVLANDTSITETGHTLEDGNGKQEIMQTRLRSQTKHAVDGMRDQKSDVGPSEFLGVRMQTRLSRRALKSAELSEKVQILTRGQKANKGLFEKNDGSKENLDAWLKLDVEESASTAKSVVGGRLLQKSTLEGENLSNLGKAVEITLQKEEHANSVGVQEPLASEQELEMMIPREEICALCQFGGADGFMLLCDGDGCTCAIHTFCLSPPLQKIPEGDWLCLHCTLDRTTKKRGKKCANRKFPTKVIELILGRRQQILQDGAENSLRKKLEYMVKWKSLSHHHDTWVPEDWMLFVDSKIVWAFQRVHPLLPAGVDVHVDERKLEWLRVDRIIACSDSPGGKKLLPPKLCQDDDSRLQYLVKWMNVDYKGSTWEGFNSVSDIQAAVVAFIERHTRAEDNNEGSVTRMSSVAASIKNNISYVQGGKLYGYQVQGLRWLVSSFEERKSVILADEMGLGKTAQSVAFIACIRQERLSQKPVLVIAPKSTLSGWEQEFRQWAPKLNVVIYQGDKDTRSLIQKYEFYTENNKPLVEVLVTSYELALMDNPLLCKFQWSAIIVDEGHRIKNVRSKLAGVLKKHKCEFRLLLTGTPVQNTLTELFSLLHFLDPNEFPDPEVAAQQFTEVDADGRASTSGAEGIEQQVSRIHDLLRPRMLRRLKSEVLRDLIPGKKIIEVPCTLTAFQRKLYVLILRKNYKVLNKGVKRGLKRSLNSILIDLKMVCNHPYLFPGKEPLQLGVEESFKMLVGASGKLQLLQKLLPLLREGGHRVLLFSQMTKMLDILEDFLSFLGYSYCRIDGSTTSSDRQHVIEGFNSKDSGTFVFLASTRAGGLGINLPSADTVIIYDLDFNPFVDLQAQSRAHRIGQEKTVLVFQLVTKCSVEEKILKRSRQKLAMENLVMSTERRESETAADINSLLLHGACKILDEHDPECTSITYNDEFVRKLLDREISDQVINSEVGLGYLGAVQDQEVKPSSVNEESDDSPKIEDGKEWQELLQGLAEQDDEEELGRGKRARKPVQYSYGETREVVDDDEEYEPVSSSENSSSSDASLDRDSEVNHTEQFIMAKNTVEISASTGQEVKISGGHFVPTASTNLSQTGPHAVSSVMVEASTSQTQVPSSLSVFPGQGVCLTNLERHNRSYLSLHETIGLGSTSNLYLFQPSAGMASFQPSLNPCSSVNSRPELPCSSFLAGSSKLPLQDLSSHHHSTESLNLQVGSASNRTGACMRVETNTNCGSETPALHIDRQLLNKSLVYDHSVPVSSLEMQGRVPSGPPPTSSLKALHSRTIYPKQVVSQPSLHSAMQYQSNVGASYRHGYALPTFPSPTPPSPFPPLPKSGALAPQFPPCNSTFHSANLVISAIPLLDYSPTDGHRLPFAEVLAGPISSLKTGTSFAVRSRSSWSQIPEIPPFKYGRQRSSHVSNAQLQVPSSVVSVFKESQSSSLQSNSLTSSADLLCRSSSSVPKNTSPEYSTVNRVYPSFKVPHKASFNTANVEQHRTTMVYSLPAVTTHSPLRAASVIGQEGGLQTCPGSSATPNFHLSSDFVPMSSTASKMKASATFAKSTPMTFAQATENHSPPVGKSNSVSTLAPGPLFSFPLHKYTAPGNSGSLASEERMQQNICALSLPTAASDDATLLAQKNALHHLKGQIRSGVWPPRQTPPSAINCCLPEVQVERQVKEKDSFKPECASTLQTPDKVTLAIRSLERTPTPSSSSLPSPSRPKSETRKPLWFPKGDAGLLMGHVAGKGNETSGS